MNINLKLENEAVKALKEELGILPQKAHCLKIELWQYASSPDAKLECHISVFTNSNMCVQSSGANFGDALEALRLNLKDKIRTFSPSEDLNVFADEN